VQLPPATHHLLKTFWVGRGGWSDEQHPDGTIVWTTPAGLRKRVPTGSRVLFPGWDTTPQPATLNGQASGVPPLAVQCGLECRNSAVGGLGGGRNDQREADEAVHERRFVVQLGGNACRGE